MPRRLWAILAVAFGVGLSVLDSAIANVALPTIGQELGISSADSIWIVNAYQLAIMVSLLSFSALGELVGYRKVYIGGLMLFTVASVGCALSSSLATPVAGQGADVSRVWSPNSRRGSPLRNFKGADAEIRADIGGQVLLIDDEQIRARDARAALARNLVALRYVDDKDRGIRQLRAEGRREIVAAALDEDDLRVGEALRQFLYSLEIHGGILADGRMGTAARLDAEDALLRHGGVLDEEFGVLLRIDIIRDDTDAVMRA